MRPSALSRAAFPVAAAIVVLAGCSGSGDEPATASPEETSAAETSTPTEEPADETSTPTEEPADSEFCAQAGTIEQEISSSVSSGDPGRLPELLRDAAEEIRTLEAPEEIAPDWTALADGVEELAATVSDIDITDPQALTTLQERLAPLQQELNEASTNVQNYLAEECGVGSPTEESAPSS